MLSQSRLGRPSCLFAGGLQAERILLDILKSPVIYDVSQSARDESWSAGATI